MKNRHGLPPSPEKPLMRPSLESLRVLEACISTGSFAAAARQLFLTPAAVSLRVRTLETELGQPLFVRTGRRVIPTDAAIALASRVREALDGISQALDDFRAFAPRLKVTAPPTFASRWLAQRLAQYTAENGVGIDLDISTDLRDHGSFDVAIRTGTGGWPGLRGFPLLPVEVTPMLAPSLLGGRTLRAPRELAEFALLPHPDWGRWFTQAGDEVPKLLRYIDVDYPTHELNAHAALDGLGAALLSPILFRSLLAEGRLLAPFSCLLAGPAWHFALVRADDARSAPAHLCEWLCRQAE